MKDGILGVAMFLVATLLLSTPTGIQATVACDPPVGEFETVGPFDVSSVRLRGGTNLRIDLDDGLDVTYRAVGEVYIRQIEDLALRALASDLQVTIEWDSAFVGGTGCTRTIRAIEIHSAAPAP